MRSPQGFEPSIPQRQSDNRIQYRDKFQGLLRELFQFDCADLDFGIYHIMNFRREVSEKFIRQDLPKAIANAKALEPVFKARMFAEVQA